MARVIAEGLVADLEGDVRQLHRQHIVGQRRCGQRIFRLDLERLHVGHHRHAILPQLSGTVGHVAHQHRVLRVAGQQFLVIRHRTFGVALPVIESGQLMVGVEVRRVTRTQLQQVVLRLVRLPNGAGGACERHE